MTAVDSPVPEFSIALYSPHMISIIIFCITLALAVSAGAWFGKRLYLHLYGVRTEGTVKESTVTTSSVKGSGISASSRVSTHHMTIEYTGPDGKRRIIKGTSYSDKIGNSVPVFYSSTHPGCAVYYDPLWHYIVPAAALIVSLFFTCLAAGLCYKDIRAANYLDLSNRSSREEIDRYQGVLSECYHALQQNPNDAAALELSGDARLALMQIRDAIDDYTKALRLRPDRRELLRKRAKAHWLYERDRDAFRDWLKSL